MDSTAWLIIVIRLYICKNKVSNHQIDSQNNAKYATFYIQNRRNPSFRHCKRTCPLGQVLLQIMSSELNYSSTAAWAAAESINDVKLLHKGYKVPIVKTPASWAIDLDSILEGYSGEDGCIRPQVNLGRTYDDYLRILLYAKEENIKTARVLDLIQINMRKNHDAFFLIPECATGVSIDADVYGRKLSYDRIY